MSASQMVTHLLLEQLRRKPLPRIPEPAAVMADAAQELGSYQGSVLVTRRGFAQSNEADLVALTRAMIAAQELIFTDKALTLSVMKKNLKGMTDADAEKL